MQEHEKWLLDLSKEQLIELLLAYEENFINQIGSDTIPLFVFYHQYVRKEG